MYPEFPQHFVWLKTQQKWKIKERNNALGLAIGHMCSASPVAGEHFCEGDLRQQEQTEG
jgi:hypothetical protein